MKVPRFNIDRLYRLLPFTGIGTLSRELTDLEFQSILDVGCGFGRVFERIRWLVTIPYTVGLDIFTPYILQAKAKNIYEEYIQAKGSACPFKDKSFDVVTAIQVIEHMDKEEALVAIKEMERVAKKKVIISTPRGFFPKGERDGNPYQLHRSAWDIDEMKNLGYRVIFYETIFIEHRETLLHRLFAYLLSVVCLKLFPYKTAGGLICVKRLQ